MGEILRTSPASQRFHRANGKRSECAQARTGNVRAVPVVSVIATAETVSETSEGVFARSEGSGGCSANPRGVELHRGRGFSDAKRVVSMPGIHCHEGRRQNLPVV